MAAPRITVLVENAASETGLLAEHGLSVWIETAHGRYLFDTGQGPALVPNARRLGIPLDQADAVILSHGHYDHTGGLAHVMNRKGRTRIHAHPAAFEPKYAQNPDGTARWIGMPDQVRELVMSSADIRWARLPAEVSPGLFLTGPIPRRTDFEDTGGPFYADARCRTPDELPDDQAIFLDTKSGIVVVLGCAHAGVINTLQYIQELTGKSRIRAVMGGMHLLAAGRDRLDRTVAGLKGFAVQELYPAHCTGREAVERLFGEFPQRCFPFSAGTSLNLKG